MACAVTSAEAVLLLGLGAWLVYENLVETPSNAAVAQGSAGYFVVLGLLALLPAAGLWRRRGWAYGAGVFLNLLALPLAWYMLRGGQPLAGLLLAAGAAGALAGLFSRPVRAVFGR